MAFLVRRNLKSEKLRTTFNQLVRDFFLPSLIVLLQQTNTADMLEEAVEYVKYLQKQIEVSFNWRTRKLFIYSNNSVNYIAKLVSVCQRHGSEILRKRRYIYIYIYIYSFGKIWCFNWFNMFLPLENGRTYRSNKGGASAQLKNNQHKVLIIIALICILYKRNY